MVSSRFEKYVKENVSVGTIFDGKLRDNYARKKSPNNVLFIAISK